MLFKLVGSLKLHLAVISPKPLMEVWSERPSISKCNSVCNVRTWLSHAPPVTVNVNYSCLGASSTERGGFERCLCCSQGARAEEGRGGQSSLRAGVNDNLILRWKGNDLES